MLRKTSLLVFGIVNFRWIDTKWELKATSDFQDHESGFANVNMKALLWTSNGQVPEAWEIEW